MSDAFTHTTSPVARWRYRWSIDVYSGSTLTSLTSLTPGNRPAITGHDVTDINASSVADPFLLVWGDDWYLFFEVWNNTTAKGEIAYATSRDGLVWSYGAVILQEPFHLSYQCVFESDGAVYMVPETRQDSAIHLYVADDFPRRWRRVATLARGLYADATVFTHEGRWWMFAQRGLDELRLFHSERLDRGWIEATTSPLFAGNRSRTRPGGRVLRDGDTLTRFAQEAWPQYGAALRAFEIVTLTPDTYEEREIAGSPILRASRQGWNGIAMHHIDAVRRPDNHWLAVVDGATLAHF
jgi:hypothetical protein